VAALILHRFKKIFNHVRRSTSVFGRLCQTLFWCWVLAAGVALLGAVEDKDGYTSLGADMGFIRDAAVWVYVMPLATLTYVIPTLLPSLVLPETALQVYFGELAKFAGMEITSGLAVGSVVDWFPDQIRQGAHLPAHFRGVYWMDGNGGCKGGGASDIASAGSGHWNPDTRLLVLPLYHPFTFSHHPANIGDVLRAWGLRWTYVFHFDESLAHADITLRVFGVDLPTGGLGSFEINASGPESDLGMKWDRPSWFGLRAEKADNIYFLRRLVDESGTVDQNVLDMFNQAYTPKVGEDESVQGFGATEGICTHPNQLIRTR